NALDAVHLRLVHAVEKLPGIRRESLHIAALAFCVQGVKGQRTFSRARHTGEHGEGAGVERDIEILEIVLAGAKDADMRAHGEMIKRSGLLRRYRVLTSRFVASSG